MPSEAGHYEEGTKKSAEGAIYEDHVRALLNLHSYVLITDQCMNATAVFIERSWCLGGAVSLQCS